MIKSDKIQPSVSPQKERELKRLKQATEDFEKIFINMTFKQMFKSLGKSGFLDGGDYQKMFEDMMIEERVKEIQKGAGFGLAKQMYAQMKDRVVPEDSAKIKELNHQNLVERIANDYRYSKRNQK